uniref:peptidyl-tRNA hydrolase n=1 Tax=Phlebotomus papatasi TaxID=29031 RepID=A0A1B0DAT5_PHLPP
MSENLVQYIIVRKDVLKDQGLYFIMSEACLVCSSVHFTFHEDPVTQKYFSDIDNMHKVVLGVDNEAQLLKLANDLKEKDFSFELRTNPEKNIPTCLAIKVYEKKFDLLLQSFVLFPQPCIFFDEILNSQSNN